MEGVIQHFRQVFQGAVLSACLLALPLALAAPLVAGRALSRLRDWLRRENKVMALLAVSACLGLVRIGATKSVVLSADPEIGPVSLEAEEILEVSDDGATTNVVGVTYRFLTVASYGVAPSPVSVRASNTNSWTRLSSLGSGWDAENPVLSDESTALTNVWKMTCLDYASLTNAIAGIGGMAQVYCGTRLPAVEVSMGRLLTLRKLTVTSSSVKVEWDVSGSVDFGSGRVSEDGAVSVFDDAHLRIYNGENAQANALVGTIDGYDGSVTDFTADGFYVERQRFWRVELVLDNLRPYSEEGEGKE